MDLTPYMMLGQTLLLVLARTAGIVLVAPVLGSAAVPMRLRYLFSVVIALAVVGRLGVAAVVPIGAGDLLAGAAAEVLVGLVLGLAARAIFAGIELGAFHVAQQMGLAMGEVYQVGAGELGGTVRRLFWMLAAVIFLAVGGHRMIIASLMKTFQAVPPGALRQAPPVAQLVASLMGAAFVLALKIAAPVLIAMLLATVALGLLQKTMPECNILSTGLPVRVLGGLVVLAAGIGVVAGLLETCVDLVGRQLSQMLKALG